MTAPWVEPAYPTQNTAHVAQAQAQLLAQYQQSPNILGLFAVLVGRIQLVENALFAVMTQRTLATASGQQLDNIGKIIGLARSVVPGGTVDAVYQIWLQAQILVNSSSGTAPNLIAICQLICAPGTTIQVVDSGPLSVRVILGGVAQTQPAAISALLQIARMAGVHLVTEYLSTTPTNSFTLDGTPAQALDNGLFAGAI